jgi:type VI secretion system protein ImpA
MSSIDVDGLLSPISDADPCGADLEYDAAFTALERAAQSKPEQQIGTTVVPAEDPDWKAVQKQAAELLARSKDLRVATQLAAALLRTSGWPGFAQGLAVLRGLAERYWQAVHPRLDADDNDPTQRVNVLMSLASPEALAAVRTTPLVASRAVGRFSLKDIEIAAGDAPAPAQGDAPSTATLDAALADCDLAELQATDAALRACVDALAGLEAVVNEHVGAASAPSFGRLTALVRRAAGFISEGVARRSPVAGTAAGANGHGPAGGVISRGGSGSPLTGEISSREDVIRALDKICAYYARQEPSSPIPLFLERCKRLVTMSFVDIVKDLVPDAMTQVEVLRGRTE